ncbi:MAG: cofactor-independent phosphoglycerate mutase [Candidatus Omnitrophica bacterium]|nr:cofactor-independent phosphoglycerate mutase [Candidatus Omnitrophota bacterium]
MKYAVLIADGMADEPLQELFGKTPLEAARTPRMDELAQGGQVGLCRTVPKGLNPASDVASLSILGYDPRRYYTGRGVLEAANIGVTLKEDEVAFRCNLMTTANGRLMDYSAGHITTQEATVLIQHLNKRLGKKGIRFYPGVSYRHLLVVKKSFSETGKFNITASGPHTLIGSEVEKNFPQGEGADFLKQLMVKSQEVLADHEVNKVRVDLGENPANMIWLWGPGTHTSLPSFKEKFGLKGAVISAIDLIKGIGRLSGLDVIEVPGATGYYDTNYEGKAAYALKALKQKDFVLVHLEATDEAGHAGDLREKITAIEKFDRHIVGGVLDGLRKMKDFRMLVMPDHATLVSRRAHVDDPVCFLLYGDGIEPRSAAEFSEKSAGSTGLIFEEGHNLMDYFILSKKVS